MKPIATDGVLSFSVDPFNSNRLPSRPEAIEKVKVSPSISALRVPTTAPGLFSGTLVLDSLISDGASFFPFIVKVNAFASVVFIPSDNAMKTFPSSLIFTERLDLSQRII